MSFELSHERERIIVNCGAYRGPKPNWWRVARASAAHSVMVVADTNSVEIRADGTLGRSPTSVARERAEHEGQQWVSATHDGYRERFGLIYARQLFLSADGEDLRGEDRLTGLPGAAFAVRFHLHPSVQAGLVRDGGAALLRMPSGVVWRLRAAGGEMGLGESIYLGSGEARRTQQVVLSGTVPPGGVTVRWAIRREPRRSIADQPQEDQFPRGSSSEEPGRAGFISPGISRPAMGEAAWLVTVAVATRIADLPDNQGAHSDPRPPGDPRPPNERSSHQVATPRGGGIAVIGSVLLAWIVLARTELVPSGVVGIVLGAGLLAAVSWFDDLRGLSPVVRLLAQAAAVAIGILFCPGPRAPNLLYLAAIGLALDLVDQSVQLHGRDRRTRRQRGCGDRRRFAAVRECRGRRRSRAPGARCRGDRGGHRFSRLELVAGADFSRRCRQRAARLCAGFSAARLGGSRVLEDRADPAALFSRRCDDHPRCAGCCAASASGRRTASISTSKPCVAASATRPWSSG